MPNVQAEVERMITEIEQASAPQLMSKEDALEFFMGIRDELVPRIKALQHEIG